MVLILSVYIYLKRFDLTFLEEKYSIKENLLGFKAVKLRSSHRGVLWKKVLLEVSQNSQENTCARVSFLIKLQALVLQLY